VFSALGMITADIVNSAERSVSTWLPFAEGAAGRLNGVFDQLDQQVLEQFTSSGIAASDVQLRRYVHMKYALQVHRLAIPVRALPLTDADQEHLIHDFEAEYERLYGRGAGYRRAGIEIVRCSTVGSCGVAAPRIGSEATSGGPDWSGAVKSERQAVFPG